MAARLRVLSALCALVAAVIVVWQTNPITQVRWMFAYMKSIYGTPCKAWAFWQTHHWY